MSEERTENNPVTLFLPLFAESPPLILITKHRHSLQLTSPSSILLRKTFQTASFIVKRTEGWYNWNAMWGFPRHSEEYKRIGPFQRISHFPGTYDLGRKDRLATNNRAALLSLGPSHYLFHPLTFLLPRDTHLFQQYCKMAPSRSASQINYLARPTSSSSRSSSPAPNHLRTGSTPKRADGLRSSQNSRMISSGRRVSSSSPAQSDSARSGSPNTSETDTKYSMTQILHSLPSVKTQSFIQKPLNAARGIGVRLVSQTDLHTLIFRTTPGNPSGSHQQKGFVLQQYISNPLCVNGYKVDLRLYVCVTSLSPLKIYFFDEGLVRFASDPYYPPAVGERRKRRRRRRRKAKSLEELMKDSDSSSEVSSDFESDSETESEDSHTQRDVPPEKQSKYSHLTNFSINKKRKSEWQRPGNEFMIPAKPVLFDISKRKIVEDSSLPVELQTYLHPSKRKPVSRSGGRVQNSIPADLLLIGDLDGDGTKWTFKQLLLYIFFVLRASPTVVVQRIQDLIIKTIMTAVPGWLHQARSTLPYSSPSSGFELFGFDVLLDDTLRPHLIEVNTSPSLQASSHLDHRVKQAMLTDLFNMIGFPLIGRQKHAPRTRTVGNDWKNEMRIMGVRLEWKEGQKEQDEMENDSDDEESDTGREGRPHTKNHPSEVPRREGRGATPKQQTRPEQRNRPAHEEEGEGEEDNDYDSNSDNFEDDSNQPTFSQQSSVFPFSRSSIRGFAFPVSLDNINEKNSSSSSYRAASAGRASGVVMGARQSRDLSDWSVGSDQSQRRRNSDSSVLPRTPATPRRSSSSKRRSGRKQTPNKTKRKTKETASKSKDQNLERAQIGTNDTRNLPRLYRTKSVGFVTSWQSSHSTGRAGTAPVGMRGAQFGIQGQNSSNPIPFFFSSPPSSTPSNVRPQSLSSFVSSFSSLHPSLTFEKWREKDDERTDEAKLRSEEDGRGESSVGWTGEGRAQTAAASFRNRNDTHIPTQNYRNLPFTLSPYSPRRTPTSLSPTTHSTQPLPPPLSPLSPSFSPTTTTTPAPTFPPSFQFSPSELHLLRECEEEFARRGRKDRFGVVDVAEVQIAVDMCQTSREEKGEERMHTTGIERVPFLSQPVNTPQTAPLTHHNSFSPQSTPSQPNPAKTGQIFIPIGSGQRIDEPRTPTPTTTALLSLLPAQLAIALQTDPFYSQIPHFVVEHLQSSMTALHNFPSLSLLSDPCCSPCDPSSFFSSFIASSSSLSSFSPNSLTLSPHLRRVVPIIGRPKPQLDRRREREEQRDESDKRLEGISGCPKQLPKGSEETNRREEGREERGVNESSDLSVLNLPDWSVPFRLPLVVPREEKR
ncbi:putative Tubulin-tyrosine ligase family protein [Blattamonas nauphoetae]|uniref:Tubulin-tyrosine ligase family protein n=1 Tax=Blattamonas nauphoetae TaxID=2049346 RepID=A0ABQ9XLU2_9EUKA|nr:putative Tubulin-tyrosine ligase family protein [Blattamonas nauphoetae]